MLNKKDTFLVEIQYKTCNNKNIILPVKQISDLTITELEKLKKLGYRFRANFFKKGKRGVL